jgi:chaperonin GroES
LTIKIEDILAVDNVAELLKEKDLLKIGRRVLDSYNLDMSSISDWKSKMEKVLTIVKQDAPERMIPWPKASNVQFPLATIASINFAANAYSEIVRGDGKFVGYAVVGKDPGLIKDNRGKRVTTYMNYELDHPSNTWQEDTDKLLHMLPVLGTVFRKRYYDANIDKVCTTVCEPFEVVINKKAPSDEEIQCITHKMMVYRNFIIENMRSEVFLDIDPEKLFGIEVKEYENEESLKPVECIEQHRFLDLDGDGYEEPYIVTVHVESTQVLRIARRFEEKDIRYNSKGKIRKILAENYFTAYHFLPSLDGSFYGLGFGELLYPINETINSLQNQILDAGSLSVLPSGFVGRGIKMEKDTYALKPGQWIPLQSGTGQKLSDNIYPLPVKEPSNVLLELLMFLVNVGKELASINDILQGKTEVQNVAASSIQALLERGLKVFNGIQGRLFRSLSKEFYGLFCLYRYHTDVERYQRVLGIQGANPYEDFDEESFDILPCGQTGISSREQRLAKAQIIGQMQGLVPEAQNAYILRALEVEDEEIERLLPPTPPPDAPPPPEVQKVLAEAELAKAMAQKAIEEAKQKSIETIIKAHNSDVRTEVAKSNMKQDEIRAVIDLTKAQVDNRTADIEHAARIVETIGEHHERLANIRQAEAETMATRRGDTNVSENTSGTGA